MSNIIAGITKDLKTVPKKLQEKVKGADGKKLILLNLPYVLAGYFCNKAAFLWRMAEGSNISDKMMAAIGGMDKMFANPLPSFFPKDLLVGIMGGIFLKVIVYYKAKNAKKFRHGMEYGSARWLVGLNGTRLFTVLYGGKVLKVGRVQTPTLAMLVEREVKIMDFQKEKYYMAHILMDGIDAMTERIDDEARAESIAAACESQDAVVRSVVKENKSVAPPKLYDLTTLQRDANRIFGFTAKQTLEYTQSLYEKKLVTYPRTDSQYLSDDMEETARTVIRAVYQAILFEEQTKAEPNIKRVLNSKKVTDHHAIIPTVEIVKADLSAVPEGEMKILSLTANRLLCATGEKQLYETVKAEFSCGGYSFHVSGKTVLQNGWKEFQ